MTLRCEIHEHMRGLILVLNTPHFVVTDAEGRFRLTGLQAGVQHEATRPGRAQMIYATQFNVRF